jgi:arginine deiminase
MDAFKPTNKNILMQCGDGVESECGKLDIVLMHRPGRELLRLTKDNLHYLLYDALPNITETHKSHDVFSQYLRDHDTHVLYLADLLHETLISSKKACHTLIDGLVSHSHFNDNQQQEVMMTLRRWLLDRTPEQLAEDAIAGVACSKAELGTSIHAQLLSKTSNEFIIPPLPNLLFMRDGFSIIEKNVFIWQMAKTARRNEPFLLRTIFQYHPYLSTSGLKIVKWQTTINSNEFPTIEGGDVAYIGQGVVLIGCSERTNRAGIEALACTGLFRQVIAIIIPPRRQYMHLDTILSSVGKHAFTLHGPLAETMEIFTVENESTNNIICSNPKWISHGCDTRQALRKLLDDPELIFYDAEDEETSVHEQRHCRHNVVVINDGHVMTYADGDVEKGVVAQMTRNNVCRVVLIPPQGLSEGGGGVHCMTNAIRRRAK